MYNVVDYRHRVILSDDALDLLLQRERSLPRFVDILVRKLAQLRQPLADVMPFLVRFPTKGDRRVDAKVRVEECRRREPLSVAVI